MFHKTLLLLVLVACKPAPPAAVEPDPPVAEETEGIMKASAKSTVRFKRNERLANDLADALGLTTQELCRELDTYDCAKDVHKVALGGVDPYTIGLYEASPETGASTTIAVDRVVLAACDKRAKGDFAAPNQAVIFAGFGASSTPESAETQTVITKLYDRGLSRAPTDAERGHLVQLFKDIVATGTPNPAQSFATLGCFAVLSSNEGVFY